MSREAEREEKARRLEQCYKTLSQVLAATYRVAVPKVEFSWKLYTDFGPGATYFFKKHLILVTYDTKPDELAHEFKHYLQDVVEGRDYDKEWEDLVWEEFKRTGRHIRIWEKSEYHPLEKDANRFSGAYNQLLQSEGQKIYGSAIWITHLLKDKFREGEIPDFVIKTFRKRVE